MSGGGKGTQGERNQSNRAQNLILKLCPLNMMFHTTHICVYLEPLLMKFTIWCKVARCSFFFSRNHMQKRVSPKITGINHVEKKDELYKESSCRHTLYIPAMLLLYTQKHLIKGYTCASPIIAPLVSLLFPLSFNYILGIEIPFSIAYRD